MGEKDEGLGLGLGLSLSLGVNQPPPLKRNHMYKPPQQPVPVNHNNNTPWGDLFQLPGTRSGLRYDTRNRRQFGGGVWTKTTAFPHRTVRCRA
ncbi:homeobox-leucine zipper protein (A) [Spatholobus suberectus]|nr:homeobox-leucine zipper protein (A) [Spatholobus suberectus]